MSFCSSDTVPEARVFTVVLGTFLHDVVLKNITFSTGVLTVEESNTRGFTIQEHRYKNGTKGYSLSVPFDSDVVLKHVCQLYCQMTCASFRSFIFMTVLLSFTEPRTLGYNLLPPSYLWVCHPP